MTRPARKAVRGVRKPGVRKNRRETEAKLLQAAVEIMSSLGYERATTKRIAETAGVNEQLITRYFGGKEGLLVAVLQQYTKTEFTREHDARPQSGASLTEVITYFLQEADFSIEHEPFSRVALHQAVVDPKVAGAIEQLCRECYRPLLREQLEDCRKRGMLQKDVDSDAIIDALIYVRLGLAAYGRVLFQIDSGSLQQLCVTFAQVFTKAIGRPDRRTHTAADSRAKSIDGAG